MGKKKKLYASARSLASYGSGSWFSGRKMRTTLTKSNICPPTEYPTSNTCSIQASLPQSSAPKLDDPTDVSGQRIKLEDDLIDNGQSFKEMIKPDSSGTGPFPGLVLLLTEYPKVNYHPFKQLCGIDLINRCLKQFNYGHLVEERCKAAQILYVRVSYDGNVLAECQGPPTEVRLAAGGQLLQMLKKTNYFIEPQRKYFQKKEVASHVLDVDPEQSHIYKVVYLKKKDEQFPYKVTGSVDYVNSEDELWLYIKNHVNSGSDADLYVLNIDSKPGYQTFHRIYGARGQNNVYGSRLLGSSNQGFVVRRIENIPKIFEELMKCGGQNIKYRLIPPSGKLQETPETSDTIANDNGNEQVQCGDMAKKTQQIKILKAPSGGIAKKTEEQIIIPAWIADKLILMDFLEPNGTCTLPYHCLRLSVLNCVELEEFIVEKKLDRTTAVYTCQALIDRAVVGTSKGFRPKKAQELAVKNALQNLRKYCVYIELKHSYYLDWNRYLIEERLPGKNTIFRVVNVKEARSESEFYKLLQQFKNSKLQDLFFERSFSDNDIQLIFSMAVDMKLRTLMIKRMCACVYKTRRPKDVYEELMKTGGENEKYRVILPVMQLSKSDLEKSHHQNVDKQSQIQTLFDFAKPNSVLGHDRQSMSKQANTHPERPDIKEERLSIQSHSSFIDQMPPEDRYAYNEGSEDYNNKKPYTEGPCIKEERLSSQSQPSFIDRMPPEDRYTYNEGSEEYNSRNNKRLHIEGPGSIGERLSSRSQPSFRGQMPPEDRYAHNEGSEEYNSRNYKRPYTEGPGSIEERLSSRSQPSFRDQMPPEERYAHNEGSEEYNSRNNKRPYIEGPSSIEERLSRRSQPSFRDQMPPEDRYAYNEGSEEYISRNVNIPISARPDSREEMLSSRSQPSFRDQMQSEDRYAYNERSEEYISRNVNIPISARPDSREERLYSQSQPSFRDQIPPEDRYAYNERSEDYISRNVNRPYSAGPDSREGRLSSQSQLSYGTQRQLERRQNYNESSGRLHNQPYNSEENDGRLSEHQQYLSSTWDSHYGRNNRFFN